MPKLGYKHSEETKAQMRAKRKPMSDETRKKISDSTKGRKVSDETKEKIRQTRLGKPGTGFSGPHSEEARKKISEKNKGKIVSEETRRKMSQSGKGVPRGRKGKTWRVIDGKRIWFDGDIPIYK